jgi:hypothetical protein
MRPTRATVIVIGAHKVHGRLRMLLFQDADWNATIEHTSGKTSGQSWKTDVQPVNLGGGSVDEAISKIVYASFRSLDVERTMTS